MHAVARTNHLGSDSRGAARDSRVPSIAWVATIVGSAFVTGLLIGWIVAASLGLGAEDHPGTGPDRPPPPILVRLHTPVA
jgi:hypothetical protein